MVFSIYEVVCVVSRSWVVNTNVIDTKDIVNAKNYAGKKPSLTECVHSSNEQQRDVLIVQKPLK